MIIIIICSPLLYNNQNLKATVATPQRIYLNNFLADQLAGWLPYYHCSRDFIRFPLKKKWGFMYKLKALLFKLFFTTILLLVVSSSSFFKRLLSNTLEDQAITFNRHLPLPPTQNDQKQSNYNPSANVRI